MKTLFACLALFLCAAVQAQNLPVPHTSPLSPAVSTPTCSAANATNAGYEAVVTGFSADGNYVFAWVPGTFTCGHSGRLSNIHTYTVCTYLQYDLEGNLVSESTPSNGAGNLPCPTVALNEPSSHPPSSIVVGNEFTNAGGYVAETQVERVCGSEACLGQTYNLLVLTAP